MRTTTRTEGFSARLGEFARKEPILLLGILLFIFLTVFWLLSSFELLPEAAEKNGAVNGAAAIEPGDSMNWIGMKVIPVSRGLRKDFKLSRKVKGIFVLDEGLLMAKKYGVKTGDVIVSIGRQRTVTSQDFVIAADKAQYAQGILLEIYRDKKTFYLTIPYEYQYGPLAGPNKGTWQLGAPVIGPAFPYGPVFNGNNNQQNQRL